MNSAVTLLAYWTYFYCGKGFGKFWDGRKRQIWGFGSKIVSQKPSVVKIEGHDPELGPKKRISTQSEN
jgi:hypothetical protein